MELWYLLPLLSFLILLLRWRRDAGSRLPPGPWTLPIIGSMHHLLGSEIPHHTLGEMARKYGPLMYLKLGETSMVVATSTEAAQEILKTHDANFATRPHMLVNDVVSYGGKGMVMAPYGDYWRHLRKLCILELLSPKRVQSFRWIRQEEAGNLVRSISAATGLVNLTEMLFSFTNDITSRALMGVKCAEQSRFIPLMRQLVQLGSAFNLADFFPSSRLAALLSGSTSRQQRCHDEADEILENVLEAHMARRRAAKDASDGRPEESDLLDVFLRIQESGGQDLTLTADHIKALLLDLFVAGSETSSSVVLWTMSELMRNPKVMQKAQAEVREAAKDKGTITEEDINGLPYLKLVIKESLRLHPPVPMLVPREAMEECKMMGYHIPKKTRAMVNVWAIGRDPRYWDDAESFVPERFEGNTIDFKGTHMEYIPFGSGRRMCAGMTFGMASVELPLALLLCHFDWELPDGVMPTELDMSESFGVTSNRKTDLRLHAATRVPVPSP